MKYKLETWTTFKKREKPTIYYASDNNKYWIRTTIRPTMRNLGWYHIMEWGDPNYDIYWGDLRPKEVAKMIIEKQFGDRIGVNVEPHFVYNFTIGENGYEDIIEVFYKLIKQ